MNQPNEPGSWNDDLSFDYLERLYTQIRNRFQMATLGNAERAIASGVPTAFVRHDTDLSLRLAVNLAHRESAWSTRSTYHVMIDCPFYSISTLNSQQAIKTIHDLGHEIGLHYDIHARTMRDADAPTRERDISDACSTLEDVIGCPVRSVSFHRPLPELLHGPLRIGGRINSYAAELLRGYLSDSRARWREGPPHNSVATSTASVLQILVHPVWWGDGHLDPELRLGNFIEEIADEQGVPYSTIRDQVAEHISFRAADKTQPRSQALTSSIRSPRSKKTSPVSGHVI